MRYEQLRVEWSNSFLPSFFERKRNYTTAGRPAIRTLKSTASSLFSCTIKELRDSGRLKVETENLQRYAVIVSRDK